MIRLCSSQTVKKVVRVLSEVWMITVLSQRGVCAIYLLCAVDCQQCVVSTCVCSVYNILFHLPYVWGKVVDRCSVWWCSGCSC